MPDYRIIIRPNPLPDDGLYAWDVYKDDTGDEEDWVACGRAETVLYATEQASQAAERHATVPTKTVRLSFPDGE